MYFTNLSLIATAALVLSATALPSELVYKLDLATRADAGDSHVEMLSRRDLAEHGIHDDAISHILVVRSGRTKSSKSKGKGKQKEKNRESSDSISPQRESSKSKGKGKKKEKSDSSGGDSPPQQGDDVKKNAKEKIRFYKGQNKKANKQIKALKKDLKTETDEGRKEAIREQISQLNERKDGNDQEISAEEKLLR